jgi:hypothetical protein
LYCRAQRKYRVTGKLTVTDGIHAGRNGAKTIRLWTRQTHLQNEIRFAVVRLDHRHRGSVGSYLLALLVRKRYHIASLYPRYVPVTSGTPCPPDVRDVLLYCVVDAGEKAWGHYVEFLTANIRNLNTRETDAQAIHRFSVWCEQQKIGLDHLSPFLVAAHIEQLGTQVSAPTARQQLVAPPIAG